MKPRIVISILVITVLGISLIAFLRKPSNQSANISVNDSATTSSSPEASGQQIQVTINGQPLEEFVAQTSRNQAEPPLSSKPLSSINASQISSIDAQDQMWLVTFTDGSQTTVSPAMQAVLPAEARSKVVYRRGN